MISKGALGLSRTSGQGGFVGSAFAETGIAGSLLGLELFLYYSTKSTSASKLTLRW